MIPDVDRHDRRLVVLVDDESQPVWEHKSLIGYVNRGSLLRLRGSGHGRQGGPEAQMVANRMAESRSHGFLGEEGTWERGNLPRSLRCEQTSGAGRKVAVG